MHKFKENKRIQDQRKFECYYIYRVIYLSCAAKLDEREKSRQYNTNSSNCKSKPYSKY